MNKDAISRRTQTGRPRPGACSSILIDLAVPLGYFLLMLPGLMHSVMLSEGIRIVTTELALGATSAAAGALILRRRAPITVLILVVVLLLPIKTVLLGCPDPLGIAIAAYAVATYSSLRRVSIAAATTVPAIATMVGIGAPLLRSPITVSNMVILNEALLLLGFTAGLLAAIVVKIRQSRPGIVRTTAQSGGGVGK